MAAAFYLASKAKTLKTGERPIVIAVHLKGIQVLTNIGFTIAPAPAATSTIVQFTLNR